MTVIHKFVIATEITSLAIGGLVFVSAAIASLRAWTSKPAAPFVPSVDVAKAEALAAKEGWLHKSLVGLDVFLNIVVLGGYPSETISAHSYRAALEGKAWGKWMNTWLNGFQVAHGQKAASGDLERSSAEVARLKQLLGV